MSFASAVINFLFVMGFIAVLILGTVKSGERYTQRIILYILLFWCSNAAFSTFASPIVLRYQVFPIVVASTFAMRFIIYVLQECGLYSKKNTSEVVILEDIDSVKNESLNCR